MMRLRTKYGHENLIQRDLGASWGPDGFEEAFRGQWRRERSRRSHDAACGLVMAKRSICRAAVLLRWSAAIVKYT